MKRHFITIVLLVLGGCAPADSSDASAAVDLGPGPDSLPPDLTASRPLVVVTLNTHSFQEGTDSLKKLDQIGKSLAALKADLVGLNEVMSGTFWSYHYKGQKYDGAALIKKALEAASGQTFHLYSKGFAHWSSGELMSNVVLSRWPITESGSRSLTTTDFWPAPKEKRNVVYARTTVPGYGPVNLLVTHTWGWDSADTAKQIAEVKSFLASKVQGDEVLNLVLGDLNLPPTHKHFSAWLAAPVKLYDTYAEANPKGSAPTTFKGKHRIDYVLADRKTAKLSSRLVFDGKDQPVVSDHLGVKTVFELRK